MTRALLQLSGTDVVSFLQGLVTNDVSKVQVGPIYAALLTPQGKYIADFFLISHADTILIDVALPLADSLAKRLQMYKLRADVTIETLDKSLHRGLGPVPEDGWQDPRAPALGWRAWRDEPASPDDTDWTALRVQNMIPETGVELTADSFILELGFEALGGVDFKKGCYVGQEVTARMKHKTELRKGLARVTVNGETGTDTEILSADGRVAGTLYTRSGRQALAYLRFDRAAGEMTCGAAKLLREA